MTKYVFKIKDTTTNLYSLGGTVPRFSKNGKIWKEKGHLTSHIQQVIELAEIWAKRGEFKYQNIVKKYLANCIVEVYTITQNGSISLDDWKKGSRP